MAGALRDQPSNSEHINELLLAGIVMEEPTRDIAPNGEKIVLLQVAFLAPDSPETVPEPEIACCEIEVPADRCLSDLAGKAIIVSGTLTGGGGVLAREIALI
jgi:hypothetical protein